MKKIVILVLSLIVLTGCTQDEQQIKSQELKVDELTKEIDQLQTQKNELLDDIKNIRVENGIEKYVVTLNISQSHVTLDIGKHIKNAMNDIEIQLPVDLEFYNSVEEGDLLDNSFRLGSLLLEGSWGRWKVKVVKKEVLQ